MKMKKIIIVFAIAAVGLLALTCSKKHPSEVAPGNDAAITANFLKSSLMQQIAQVVLRVESGDEVVYADTTMIEDGSFSFSTIDLPIGVVGLFLFGTNAAGQVIYAGDTTITVVAGEHTEVTIQLLPTVPMVKLSPYVADTDTCGWFTSTLELFNIEKFFSGTFEIQVDPAKIEIGEQITEADPTWGGLTISADISGGTAILSISRANGQSDAIPTGVYSLVHIPCRALVVGAEEVNLVEASMSDLEGPIAEAEVYVDGQEIITDSVIPGTVTGKVTDALTDQPISGANLIFGDPGIDNTQTDENGDYAFDNIPYGAHPIVVSKTGYFTQEDTITVSCSPLVVDFELQQPGSAMIVVQDQNGESAEGVSVTRSDVNGVLIDSRTTDGMGRAHWSGVTPGLLYDFFAYAPGAGTSWVELWGHVAGVSVQSGGHVTDTINRHYPFASQVATYRAYEVTETEFYLGDAVYIAVQVDNRDQNPHQVMVNCQAAQDTSAAADFEQVSSDKEIAALSSDTIMFTFVPETEGAYTVRPWLTFTSYDGSDQLTDSWPWPTEPTFTVLSPLPDLTISVVTADKDLAAPGDSIWITVEASNEGDGQSGQFYIMTFLSSDVVPASSTIDTLGGVWAGPLLPGRLLQYAISGSIPESILHGSYYICAYIDYYQDNEEADETNNTDCTGRSIGVYPPRVGVDSSRLEFVAFQYGSPPAPKQFLVTNIGAGTLSWEITNHADWLSIDPDTGTGDETLVTARITDTSMDPGTYYDTLRVKNKVVAGDSAIVEIIYAVVPSPTGSIIISVFDRDSLQTGDAFVVRYDMSWITLDTQITAPSTGEAFWAEVPADSRYNFRAFYTDQGTTLSELWGEATEIQVAENDTTVDSIYRHFPFVYEIAVFNEDGVEVTDFYLGDAVHISVWVENRYNNLLPVIVECHAARNLTGLPDLAAISPEKGIAAQSTDSITFVFMPGRAGDYYVRPWKTSAEIRDHEWLTDSQDWPDSPIFTILPVAKPDLTVLSVSIDEETITPGDSITIQAMVQNIGDESSSSFYVHTYLSVDPNPSPSSPDNVHLSGNTYGPLLSDSVVTCTIRSGLPLSTAAGTYYAGAFADYLDTNDEVNEKNNAEISEETVWIAMAHIAVDPDTLYFTADSGAPLPPVQGFMVTNNGGGTLRWAIEENIAWLNVSPTADTSNETWVSVSVAQTDLPPGDYLDTLIISSDNANNSPQSVVVKYTINKPAPHIGLDPPDLSFVADSGGVLPEPQDFNISNTGADTLHWELEESLDWLEVSPLADTSNNTDVFASITTTDLPPQEYQGVITVNSDNADNSGQVVNVSYTINAVAPPDLVVEPDTLEFTAYAYDDFLPADQPINITNAGGGELNWSVSESIGWLNISKTSGTNDDAVLVSINSTNFLPDTLNGTIIVSTTSPPETEFVAVRYIIKMPGWIYSGSGYQEGNCIDTAVANDGYIIAGYTMPIDGFSDTYLLHISEFGDSLGSWVYPHNDSDRGMEVITTSDNNYVIAGYAGYDGVYGFAYLMQVDPSGTMLWDSLYGGDLAWDRVESVVQTADGGYVAVGAHEYAFTADAYVIRTDSDGHLIWEDFYGYADWDEAHAVHPTPNGNYIMAGQAKPVDNGAQAWLFEFDDNGGFVWTKNYGDPLVHDAGNAFVPTSDGKWMVAGYTSSHGSGLRDFYIFKSDSSSLDCEGWSGGSDMDLGQGIAQVSGGYIVVGTSKSFGPGDWDMYVVKFDYGCNKLWSRRFGGPGDDGANSVVVTSDGGCIIVGATESFGAKERDLWVLRLNADGTIWEPGF